MAKHTLKIVKISTVINDDNGRMLLVSSEHQASDVVVAFAWILLIECKVWINLPQLKTVLKTKFKTKILDLWTECCADAIGCHSDVFIVKFHSSQPAFSCLNPII